MSYLYCKAKFQLYIQVLIFKRMYSVDYTLIFLKLF